MMTQHCGKEIGQINHLLLSQSYFKGIQSTPLTNSPIGEYFSFIVDKNPEALAVVVHHQGIRLTYKEFQKKLINLLWGYWHLA